MTDRLHDYLTFGFGAELRKSSAGRASASVRVAELWGAAGEPEFSQLVDFLGAQSSYATPEVGEFFAFSAADFVPPTSNALLSMLAQPFRRAALFTGTLALGSTSSGDTWLIETAAPHRVFLHDHDSGDVEPVADGLASFAWLCHVLGDASHSADDWQLLEGRVRRCRDVAVPANVTPWASDGVVEARHRAARDLTAALEHGATFEVMSQPLDASSPASLVAGALRLFLREDPAFDQLGPLLAAHAARLVKETATALRQRAGHRGYEARLRSLGTFR
jgi:hypothetical protein